MTDDGEVVAAHRRRLQMLDAVHAAYGRRSEVLEIVCAAETSEDALLPVQHLLGITQEDAWAVIDLQLARFTRSKMSRIEQEREQLRAELG